MILISHRGNLNGPQPDKENKLDYILDSIRQGYDVEVDLWYIDGIFKLGHDRPEYELPLEFIEKYSNKLWLHCKDMQSLSKLNEIDRTGDKLNYFSHEKDLGVLTSKGFIWSTNQYQRGILVMPEIYNKTPLPTSLGVCSDYVSNYR